jgi:hypothetical protein
MYDDERVLDAVLALREQGGRDWWLLLVDQGETYAGATFGALTSSLRQQGQAGLDRLLGDLVGDVLHPVEVVVDRAAISYEEAIDRAAATTSGLVVVQDQGEVVGVISAIGTRSAGLFDPGLVQLAGQISELPERGLLSRRRAAATQKRKSKSTGEPEDKPKTGHKGA